MQLEKEELEFNPHNLLEGIWQKVVQLTETSAGFLFHLSISIDRYEPDRNKLIACTENLYILWFEVIVNHVMAVALGEEINICIKFYGCKEMLKKKEG